MKVKIGTANTRMVNGALVSKYSFQLKISAGDLLESICPEEQEDAPNSASTNWNDYYR